MKGFDSWMADQAKKFSKAKDKIGSYEFSAQDRIDMKHLRQEFVRASAPTGALVIWNQLTAHGSQPNKSDRFRCAQFVKMFRKHLFVEKRLQNRAHAIKKNLPPAFKLSRTGAAVFGFGK